MLCCILKWLNVGCLVMYLELRVSDFKIDAQMILKILSGQSVH